MRVHSPRTTSDLVTSFSYVPHEHWRNLFGGHRRQVKDGAVCVEKCDINPVDFPPATPLQLCFFLLNQNDLRRRRIRHHSPNFLQTSLIPVNSVPAALELLSQSCLLTPGGRQLGACTPPPGEHRSCFLLLQLLFMAFVFCVNANVHLCLCGSLCVRVCVENWKGLCLRAFLHLYI